MVWLALMLYLLGAVASYASTWSRFVAGSIRRNGDRRRVRVAYALAWPLSAIWTLVNLLRDG